MYIHFGNKELNEFTSTEFQLENGLNIKIDDSSKTAGVILSTETDEDVFIPKYFEHQSKQYIIKYIDTKAFHLNKNIKSITFSEDSEIETIKDKAFSYSSIEKLSIPASLVDLRKDWCCSSTKLNQIIIDPRNQHFIMTNEKLMIGKSNLNSNFDVIVFACRDIGEVVDIPNNIVRIAPHAFSGCNKMKMVTFSEPSSLKLIDDFAFYCWINIEKIKPVPHSVAKIGYQSFIFANKLKSIEFLSDELHICDSCFNMCSSLLLISCPNIHKITIDSDAFYISKKGVILLVQNGTEFNGYGSRRVKKKIFI